MNLSVPLSARPCICLHVMDTSMRMGGKPDTDHDKLKLNTVSLEFV